MEHAEKNGNNVVILDTAGRLHIDEGMMEELQKIKQAVTVHQTLLVVDAMTGQDAVNVAKEFDEKVGIDGVILSKMDGDTRGGAALSIKAVTACLIFCSSSIMPSSICRRPAVSRITTLLPFFSACSIAAFAMSTGLWLVPMEKTSTCCFSPLICSCSIAAGR